MLTSDLQELNAFFSMPTQEEPAAPPSNVNFVSEEQPLNVSSGIYLKLFGHAKLCREVQPLKRLVPYSIAEEPFGSLL